MSSPEVVFCSCSSFLDVSSQGCGALAYFGSFPDSGQVCAVLADGNGDLMLGGSQWAVLLLVAQVLLGWSL